MQPTRPALLLPTVWLVAYRVVVSCRRSLQDGNTTNEEVLRAMVLDGAVDEDAVDADVFDIVDK